MVRRERKGGVIGGREMEENYNAKKLQAFPSLFYTRLPPTMSFSSHEGERMACASHKTACCKEGSD